MVKNNLFENKRGWIRVVEVFFSILLIGTVIIVAINSNSDDNEDISIGIHESEISILRAVQLNENLRADILGLNDGNLPLDSNNSLFPQNVKAEIIKKTPAYLECLARICTIRNECVPDFSSSTDIYTSQVVIFANLQINNPRKVVISCSLK